MNKQRQIKDLKNRLNDDYILAQYKVTYGINDMSRYKHIDELLLADNKVLKATLGPSDMSIYPFNGTNIFTVTAAEENRIDIVAYKVYGAANLYWVLCYFNAISDPLNLPVGTVLFIPELTSLKQFPNPLS
jgi:hypothetical protein